MLNNDYTKHNFASQKFFNASQKWTQTYLQRDMAYPSEYVIRIFKGEYPRLNFNKNRYPGQTILDIGCGDGRNLMMLRQCGLSCYGVEINDEIVEQIKGNFNGIGGIEVKTGHNANLPFEEDFFDYVLSWNSCYYMGDNMDFLAHVREFARVLKPRGTLVLSIPKKTCFIYRGCDIVESENGEKYAVIRNDPFQIRNGVTLKFFDDEKDIARSFSSCFDSFVFGSIHDDCFGYDYHWHLIVCQKKDR